MATHALGDGNAVVVQWTNGSQAGEMPAGYYAGSPLAKLRDLTAAEAVDLAAHDAANAAAANDSTIRQQAAAALAANRAFSNAVKPTTAAAQASQAYDQAVRLSRQNNGLIRLLLNLLDGTD